MMMTTTTADQQMSDLQKKMNAIVAAVNAAAADDTITADELKKIFGATKMSKENKENDLDRYKDSFTVDYTSDDYIEDDMATVATTTAKIETVDVAAAAAATATARAAVAKAEAEAAIANAEAKAAIAKAEAAQTAADIAAQSAAAAIAGTSTSISSNQTSYQNNEIGITAAAAAAALQDANDIKQAKAARTIQAAKIAKAVDAIRGTKYRGGDSTVAADTDDTATTTTTSANNTKDQEDARAKIIAANAANFAKLGKDIHNCAGVVESSRRQLCNKDAFDWATVTGFLDTLQLVGMTTGRQSFYTSRLRKIIEQIQQTRVSKISDLDKQQCRTILAYFVSNPKNAYASETKVAYALCLKRLVQYSKTGTLGSKKIYDNEEEDDKKSNTYVPEISWIAPGRYRNKESSVNSEDLLTPDEFTRMLQATGNTRDRAMLWVMYEGAFRPGELLNMRVGGIEFADRYMKVSTTGKTGHKSIALVLSLQSMIDWLSVHPYPDDPQAPLWYSSMTKSNGCGLSYASLCKIVKRSAQRAKIKKKVWSYLLRHTQLTNMAKKLPDQLLRVYGNWSAGSKMADKYVHIASGDMYSAILKLHGIATDEDGQEIQSDDSKSLEKTITNSVGKGVINNNNINACQDPAYGKPTKSLSLHDCPRCKVENPPDMKICHSCGLLLDESELAKIEMSDVLRSRMRDKIIRTQLVEKDIDALFTKLFGASGSTPNNA